MTKRYDSMASRAPEVGDFVWCNFPFREKPQHPADAMHAVYILATKGDTAVAAIYTTTALPKPTQPKSPYTIAISEDASRKMGMTRPFTIDPSRVAFLPINEAFFPGADNGKVPIIGQADDRLQRAIESRLEAAVHGNHLETLGPRQVRSLFMRPFG